MAGAAPVIDRMRDSITGDARLALDLVLTIRHEGDGKVTDDLTGPAALAASVRARHDALPGAERHLPDAACLTAVRDLRTALRALFAHAVRPAPAGPADANCLLSVPEALRRLNEAAARTPTVPVLTGDEDGDPLVPRRPVPDGADDLTAMLAGPPSASSPAPTGSGCTPATPRAVCATS
ncbi:ABATE domain-containing protein [Streptomyces sp. NPDC047860]|uniref:ABATE domain-containing protein n=1 Tax=Streptomyces sp. NPDC047860 TaxID=3155743 RepID=UPI0033FA8816